MNPSADNGWKEYKQLVLSSMTDCKVTGERTYRELVELRVAFEKFAAGMKVRAGTWGLVAGLIPAIGVLLVLVLKGYVGR